MFIRSEYVWSENDLIFELSTTNRSVQIFFLAGKLWVLWPPKPSTWYSYESLREKNKRIAIEFDYQTSQNYSPSITEIRPTLTRKSMKIWKWLEICLVNDQQRCANIFSGRKDMNVLAPQTWHLIVLSISQRKNQTDWDWIRLSIFKNHFPSSTEKGPTLPRKSMKI